MKVTSSEKGFTLIELSIVLVIISLIVAGIVGGQSLIHSAQLRSVVAEVRGFQTAINTYKDYYGYFPGDHPNAQSYWPTECVDIGANKCNGNGNGRINTTATHEEGLRMWQHLSLAAMTPGSYTGDTGGSLVYTSTAAGTAQFNFFAGIVTDDNFPYSKLNGGRYGGAYWVSKSQSAIFLAKQGLLTGIDSIVDGVVTPSDAEVIDKKMDDGLPGKGGVTSANRIDNLCLSGTSPNYSYKLADTNEICLMFFAID